MLAESPTLVGSKIFSLRKLRPILYVGVFFVIGLCFFSINTHNASAAACTTKTGALNWVGASFNVGCGGSGGLPLAADDVVISANSQMTIATGVAAVAKSVQMANPAATGTVTLTMAGTATLTISGTLACNGGTAVGLCF